MNPQEIVNQLRRNFLESVTNVALGMAAQIKEFQDIDYIIAPGPKSADARNAAEEAIILVSAWLVCLGETRFADAGYVRMAPGQPATKCVFDALSGPIKIADQIATAENGHSVVVHQDGDAYLVDVTLTIQVRVERDFKVDEAIKAKASGLILNETKMIKD